jgi:hypothetical protein
VDSEVLSLLYWRGNAAQGRREEGDPGTRTGAMWWTSEAGPRDESDSGFIHILPQTGGPSLEEGDWRDGGSFQEGDRGMLLSAFCVLPTDITTVCPFPGAWPEELRQRVPPG